MYFECNAYIYQTRNYTNFYLSEAQIIFIEHPRIQTTGVIFSVLRKEYFAIPLYSFLCNNDSSFYLVHGIQKVDIFFEVSLALAEGQTLRKYVV